MENSVYCCDPSFNGRSATQYPLLSRSGAIFFNMVNQWHIRGNPHFQSSAAGSRKAPSGKSRHNKTICHCLGLGHETIVCLFIFLWIFNMVVLLRGTSVSWFLPRTWSPVTDMQHYYLARYPNDDWHLANMFSQAYFSVVVCLRGLYHNSLSSWLGPCISSDAPPQASSRENTKRKGLIEIWLLIYKLCVLSFRWILG